MSLTFNEYGTNIKGAGTTTIKINVEELHGSEYQIIPDRIEAGSYMCMAAAMGEEVVLNNIVPKHEALTVKLRELGVDIQIDDEKAIIRKQSPYKNVDIKTLVYPGLYGSSTTYYTIIIYD